MDQFRVDLENSSDLLKNEKLHIYKLIDQFVSTSGRNQFGLGRLRVSFSNFGSGLSQDLMSHQAFPTLVLVMT